MDQSLFLRIGTGWSPNAEDEPDAGAAPEHVQTSPEPTKTKPAADAHDNK